MAHSAELSSYHYFSAILGKIIAALQKIRWWYVTWVRDGFFFVLWDKCPVHFLMHLRWIVFHFFIPQQNNSTCTGAASAQIQNSTAVFSFSTTLRQSVRNFPKQIFLQRKIDDSWRSQRKRSSHSFYVKKFLLVLERWIRKGNIAYTSFEHFWSCYEHVIQLVQVALI